MISDIDILVVVLAQALDENFERPKEATSDRIITYKNQILLNTGSMASNCTHFGKE